MRILIADEFSPSHLDRFKALGLTVDYRPGVKGAELSEAIREASILVVRSTDVSSTAFEVASRLSLVVRAGAGVNTIDVKAASARGIYVANCPGQNAIAVAELTWGLILALDRHIPDSVASLREGKWNKKRFSKARGLYGRTLGLVGVGAIGSAVGQRAACFGMRVVAHSRTLTERRAQSLGFEREDSVIAVARQADVLSVHVPASGSTRALISREVLAALPNGALFINTSRADVVDQQALLEEATAGRIRVGVDVYEHEPKGSEGMFDSPLAKLPAVYGTHHTGASTDQAQEAIAEETVRIVETFLRQGTVPNCVNVAERTPARYQLIVRHLDQVGVLAKVLSAIREAGINVQEMENTVFDGALAACAKVQLESRPPPEVLASIRASPEVLAVDVVELS